jgi:hypothetical protein
MLERGDDCHQHPSSHPPCVTVREIPGLESVRQMSKLGQMFNISSPGTPLVRTSRILSRSGDPPLKEIKRRS